MLQKIKIKTPPLLIFSGLLAIFFAYQYTDFFLSLDAIVNQKTNLIHTPFFTKIITLWTRIFDPNIFVIWFGVLSLFLWQRKKRNEVLFLGTSLVLGVGLKTILKILIARPRPIDHLLETSTFSFPSGHATIATLFFLGIYLSFSSKIQSPLKKKFFLTGCILGMLSISFSRVYLHMHYLSDVFAGMILGMLIVFHLPPFKIFSSQK